jgi:hypothetical protein
MKGRNHGYQWPEVECPNCRELGYIDVELVAHAMHRAMVETVHDRREGESEYEMSWSDGYEDITNFLIGLWCARCGHDFTDEQNNEVGGEVGLTFYHTKLAAVTAMLEAEGYRDVSIRHSKNKEVK